MLKIDADAHVIETPRTWSFMGADEQEYRPQIFVRNPADGAPMRSDQRNEYWKLGEKFWAKTNVGFDVPEEARDMIDIERRLKHMDEIDIDVQILYPTMFLRPMTKDHYVEFALARAYNRWLADIWKQAKQRLLWVAAPPLLSLIDAGKVRAELEFCKENGACGIFMRGMECERMVTDKYFDPLYEMAQELDLAICFHAGNNSFANFESAPPDAAMMQFKFPVMGAFCNLLMKKTPERFPALRWAFVEISAQWVPFILNEVAHRVVRSGGKPSDTMLSDSNFYITTQKSDQLNWLLSEIGEDNLIVGTDYGHNDTATEIDAIRRLGTDGTLTATAVNKILAANPSKLYGL